MYSVDNNKEYCIICISLVLQNTHLAMHGSMNVRFVFVSFLRSPFCIVFVLGVLLENFAAEPARRLIR